MTSDPHNLNVAIVGAGVVGLTTALLVKDYYRHVNLTILAEKRTHDTTSDGAAGIFRPGTSFMGPSVAVTKKWIRDSFEHWSQLEGKCGLDAGVIKRSGFIFSNENKHLVRNSYLEKLVPLYRRATNDELRTATPTTWKHGSYFHTLVIDCSDYLPWAEQQLHARHVHIQNERVDNFRELHAYDLIINCAGLGAKTLCADAHLVPIRGQVQKVHAPWIDKFYYAETDTYVIPGRELTTLGGCRNYDSYNLNVCAHDTRSIRERCGALIDVGRTEVVREWVGLRPHRASVRVEKEIRNFGMKRVGVIHNYGHGGYGVTTAPGTALYAVRMIHELLAGGSKL